MLRVVLECTMADDKPGEVRLYSHIPNSGIVHLPGRRFPAVAIQGDSIRSLLDFALYVAAEAKRLGQRDLWEEAVWAAERIEGHLLHYEAVLAQEGFSLPYTRSVKETPVADGWDGGGEEAG
jgi:hypothetical protein